MGEKAKISQDSASLTSTVVPSDNSLDVHNVLMSGDKTTVINEADTVPDSQEGLFPTESVETGPLEEEVNVENPVVVADHEDALSTAEVKTVMPYYARPDAFTRPILHPDDALVYTKNPHVESV